MENKNSKAFIPAAKAREIAENTAAVKNHIAKFIQEEAKEGRTVLRFGTYALCEEQINNISKELENLGYEVAHNLDENELVIKW